MKYLLLLFFLFSTINVLLYVGIMRFHASVSFKSDPPYNYALLAYHYFKEPQMHHGAFNFLRALGVYDAQIYLKIAHDGYPAHPKNTDLDNKSLGALYAFFPFYPLILHGTNVLFNNIELTAFVVANVLLVLNFFSMYIVGRTFLSKKSALKSIFLLFLFPFGIFYRSYFSEGVYLLLLLWYSYFLIRKQMLASAFCLSLLNVTRGNGLLLNALFLYYAWKEMRNGAITLKRCIVLLIILFLPISLWVLFCYYQTGSPFYFYNAESAWSLLKGVPPPLTMLLFPLYNIMTILSFPTLPFHSQHASQIDILVVASVFVLLVKSKKFLPKKLWLISLFLWFTPLVVKDIMSFTRLQIVSFPLFMYLGETLGIRWYIVVVTLFLLGLFFTSLFFVNWYWIG